MREGKHNSLVFALSENCFLLFFTHTRKIVFLICRKKRFHVVLRPNEILLGNINHENEVVKTFSGVLYAVDKNKT